ncbi:hypothetical protein [Streptomyces sp. NPDC047453]|uniref:hypothetical protein n=1 Tax=Streptomyces sp. NPDC047453 TaxID=3154812 RepID=UPI0033FB2B5B
MTATRDLAMPGRWVLCRNCGEEGTIKQFLTVGVDEETIARIVTPREARASWGC